MRVLQLIDSLEVGGAERMAVNIANALATKIEGSYLCTTRAEGLLKDSIHSNVHFLFLNKPSVWHLKSILKFNSYINKEGIQIIHAHSSSFFLASIIHLFNKRVKVVWHDHYGNSSYLENRKFKVLKLFSVGFSHIFSVNNQLAHWAKIDLKAKSVSYLPNFAVINDGGSKTNLYGQSEKRIICLANLRAQKDHINLLEAFKAVIDKHPNWSLHLVGKDFNDSYSQTLKSFIENNNLDKHVYIYGSRFDTFHILSQCNIGVLSSKSEGLPVALLEYGLAKLPVVATHVGDCDKIISSIEEGFLVAPEKPNMLADAINRFIEDINLRNKVSENLHAKVVSHFSEKKAIESLLNIYSNCQK